MGNIGRDLGWGGGGLYRLWHIGGLGFAPINHVASLPKLQVKLVAPYSSALVTRLYSERVAE